MDDLIKQLEKASGPDHRLDWLIHSAIDGNTVVPRYTSSIDTAITLVPKGASWTIEQDAAWVRWMGKDDVEEAQGVLLGRGGECTPIAICIAALKAIKLTH